MTQALEKVAMYRNESVYTDIMIFLNRLNVGNGDKLKSTAADYERDIKKFFKLMLRKELNELTIPDLFVMRKDVEEFQTFLGNQGLKSATINRNVNSMRSLYKFFEESGMKYRFRDADNEWVYIKSSPWNVDPVVLNDSESYGMYNHDEVVAMIELAKELPNGEEKSAAIELASVTSFRIEAIVTLKYSQFRKEGDTWVAKTIDKKKIHEKSIRTDLYERLLAMKKEGDDKIFHMSTKTLERTIETLKTKLGLEDRNLSFHSLKKYGIGEVYMITDGDRLATASQGNHSSFETAEKYYLMFSKNYATMPSLLIGQKVDTAPLEELSKEELLELITSSSRAIQFELLNKMKNKAHK